MEKLLQEFNICRFCSNYDKTLKPLFKEDEADETSSTKFSPQINIIKMTEILLGIKVMVIFCNIIIII